MEATLTCFFGADRQLLAGEAAADLVVGIHADAINTRRMQLHDVGLVVGGRDVPGGVHVVPGVCGKNVELVRSCIRTWCHRRDLPLETPTRLVLILNVVAGDDAVPIKPLDPA